MPGGIKRGIRASLIAGAVSTVLSSSAAAGTITPNTTSDQFGSDSGQCALREAVEAARLNAAFGGCAAGSGADVIPLPAVTFELTLPGDENSNAGGDLDVFGTNEPVTISHTGISPAVIDANDIDRAIQIDDDNDSLTISGITITNATSPSGFNGGAIRNGGKLVMTNSTISDSATDANGGAITNQSSDATTSLTNVTLFGNRAGGDGGAINMNGGTVTLANVTITQNTAGLDGGDGGGVSINGTFETRSSIVAGNIDANGGAPDCTGTPNSLGANLFGDGSGCSLVPGVDVVDPSPGLGPLAANGGPTPTVALLPGSPALSLGTACPSSDQRGVPRSLGGTCDSGAYERVKCRGVLVNRVGTSAKDKLTGTGKADGVLALGGNDTLKGLGGNDGLCGGKGRDKLLGGKGRDRLSGQAGRDTLNGGPKRDRCSGGPGRDRTRRC